MQTKIRAAYDLIPELKHLPAIAKKKRSLLPFVGGILNTLFGTATDTDLVVLRKQILALYNSSVIVQNVINHDTQRLASFMSLSQQSFRNLNDMVQKGFASVNHDLFRQSFLRVDFQNQILRILTIVFEKFAEYLQLIQLLKYLMVWKFLKWDHCPQIYSPQKFYPPH